MGGADVAHGPAGIPTGTAVGGDLTGTYPSPTIGSNKIDGSKVADGTLTGADIQDTTIQGADLAIGAVSSQQINDHTITATDIFPGSITTNEISDNTIQSTDLDIQRGELKFQPSGANTYALSVSQAVITSPVFAIKNDGTLQWGPTAGPMDVSLSRNGVGDLVLNTDLTCPRCISHGDLAKVPSGELHQSAPQQVDDLATTVNQVPLI